jgi:hypothetical protein
VTARAALLAALSLLGGPAAAQEAWVRALAERAPLAQRDGRYDRAVAEIDAGLARCGPAAAGAKCRAVLNYTAAYVAEREAAASKGGSALRETAAAAYRRVLADEPRHAPTVRALARLLRAEGAYEPAAALLVEAGALAPGNAALALDLGDLYVAMKKPREAVAAYERAAESPAPGSSPPAKITDAYGLLPADAQAELLARARGWRPHQPAASRAALEAVMARAAREQPRLAADALVEWVDQLGAERALTLAAVDALALPADLAARRDLRAYLTRPWEVPAGSWWRQDERRMDALARASLAVGAGMARADRPADAERCWQVAAHLFPWPSVAKVEVQTELAGLYARHPDLDGSGAKAEALVQELFEGKGLAYRRADLAAIQQYHTVLGVFLYERGVFGSATTPKSALFQLEHALNMAQRRESEGTPHQPLAELRMRLAESYGKAGRPHLAARAYVIAAQAFLDEDQLARAREAIGRARAAGGAVPSPLVDLLELRAAVAAGAVVGEGRAGRLFEAPWPPPLGDSFRERQEFKVLADLAVATRAVAPAARALARRRAAPLVLVGSADQLRLEAVERMVAGRFGIDDVLVRSAWPARADATLRKFYATSTPNPEYVYVPADTLLGARIVEAAGVPPGDAPLSLDDGTLSTEGGDDPPMRAFLARAEKVPGVRVVRPPPR